VELHPAEKVVFEGHPSWRSIISFYIKGLLVAAVAGGIAALVTEIGDNVDWAVVGLVALVVFLGVVVIGFIRRITTTYTITNQRLHIRTGILTKHVQQTKLERVQNVNTHQTFVDRLLRVGLVDFDTAGTDDSDFTFHGVNNPIGVVAAVDRAQREAADEAQAAPPAPDRPAEDPSGL
jgi:uncharacterized membrane protein YdbT with pleckstrin-like domain